ncbi:Imm32 family immunity protein [Lentzea flava]|uniref:Uncharacterized protein n=1 Tax=Lentzea flava TaxID=103732 RepID=A0ABQ2V1A9_9PSEU|nr:hypothetical protein [Lentzea flava]MCP2202424.1 hypothetical protein [Lentzea flava]GGU61318.1 hypothetical protein GCM10010178_62000 [Lentzea flava]
MQVLRHDTTRELELRGTAAELTDLARLLVSGHGSVDLGRVDDPAPYGRCLSRLNVVQASGPIAVVCAAGSDELTIRGGSAQLTLLAANVRGFANDGDATSHLHIDHFPGHDYLDESSEPLVVALA